MLFPLETDLSHAGWKEAQAMAPVLAPDAKTTLQTLAVSFKAVILNP